MQVDQEMLFEIILVTIPHTSSFVVSLIMALGSELFGYQAPPRHRLQDRRKHDQGQVPRGNQKNIQHHK